MYSKLTKLVPTPIQDDVTRVKNLHELTKNGFYYQSLQSEQTINRHTPLFMEGSVNNNQILSFFTAYTKMIEVGCYRLKPSFVFGKGLIGNPDKKIFFGIDLIIEEEHLVSKLWRSPLIKEKDSIYYNHSHRKIIEINETAVLLMKAADHIYGHWLVDILPKLSILKQCGFHEFKNLKYIISSKTPSFAEELLRLAGITQEMLIKVDDENEDIYCKDLIVPSVCRFRSVMSPIANNIYNLLIKSGLTEINQNLSSTKPERKIYLSRKKWTNPSRRMVNSNEVEDCLKQLDFEIIYPEELTIVEQIYLFQQSVCVIGESGSALHNTVFSNEDCKVGVLQGNNNGNFIQSTLSDMRSQQTGYFFGDSFFRPGNGMTGDFLIPVFSLKRVVQKYFF